MQPASSPPEFAQTLRDVLALPPEDQARLQAVLERVTGSLSRSSAPPSVAMSLAPAPMADAEQQVDVAEWLQQVRALPAWTQLQLLDEALESADDPQEFALLEGARSQLLHLHPPLAVRRAVVALATRQPIATCVGSVGLVVGVIGIGRVLARVVF